MSWPSTITATSSRVKTPRKSKHTLSTLFPLLTSLPLKSITWSICWVSACVLCWRFTSTFTYYFYCGHTSTSTSASILSGTVIVFRFCSPFSASTHHATFLFSPPPIPHLNYYFSSRLSYSCFLFSRALLPSLTPCPPTPCPHSPPSPSHSQPLHLLTLYTSLTLYPLHPPSPYTHSMPSHSQALWEVTQSAWS